MINSLSVFWDVPDQTWRSSIAVLLPEEVQLDYLEKSVDPCIHDPILRAILAELRHGYQVFVHSRKDVRFQTQEAHTYLRTRIIHCSGSMQNYWVGMRESIATLSSDSTTSALPSLTAEFQLPPTYQTCIDQSSDIVGAKFTSMPPSVAMFTVLAMHVWCRTVGQTDSCQIGNRTDGVYRGNLILLGKMKEDMSRWEREASDGDQQRYASARLFAAYVGAQMEWAAFQMNSANTSVSTTTTTVPGAANDAPGIFGPVKGFFNTRLAEQARTLGLISWIMVKEVLEGFIYSDVLSPHPSTWFYLTMAAREDGSV